MRWFRPGLGAIRYRTFFALLPVTIGVETVWLERVKVEEMFRHSSYFGFYWDMMRFVPLDYDEAEDDSPQ